MEVFVYGTLTDPAQARSLLDSFEYVGSATFEGCHRVDGRYPTLAPGGSVEGQLLRTPDRATLDRYEGVDRGLYVRVSVPLVAATDDETAQPDRTVSVYIGDPARLDAAAEWPGDGPFEERVRDWLDDSDGRVRLNTR